MDFIEPEIISAEISLVLVLISLALSAASALLAKKQKQDKTVLLDDRPQTLASRGEHLPIVIGVERVGAIVGWVGRRVNKNNVWHEDAMHLLCLGPDTTLAKSAQNPKIALKKILKDGKTIWQGKITPKTQPSGSVISLSIGGSFAIYWGEIDQKNQQLEKELNRQIFSGAEIPIVEMDKVTFPFIVRIVWLDFKLGVTPIWSQLDYILEVQPIAPNLIKSKGWNDETLVADDFQNTYLGTQNVSTNQLWVFACSDILKSSESCPKVFSSRQPWPARLGRRLDLEPGSKLKLKDMTVGNGTYTVVSSEFHYNKWFPFDQATIYIGINLVTLKESTSGFSPNKPPFFFNRPLVSVEIGQNDGGANPAHIIDQLMFSRWPHGMAKDIAKYDLDSLETVGTALEVTNKPESLGNQAHILLQGGITFSEILTLIFQDLSLVLPLDSIAKRYSFQLIRKPTPPFPHLQEALMLPPLPEIVTVHEEEAKADHLVYVFKDQQHRHRDATIFIDEDGRARLGDLQHARKITLTIARDVKAAMKIANRRQYEDLSDGVVYKIKSSHAARLLRPGRPFTAFDISNVMRIVSVLADTLSSKCIIEAVKDNWGVPVSSQSHTQGGGISPIQTPTADIDFLPIEVSGFLCSRNEMCLWVPRVRGLNSISAKINLWVRHPTAPTATVSVDNTLYNEVAINEGFEFGGNLVDAFSVSDAWDMTSGPDVKLSGNDVSLILDLSGDEKRFKEGTQIMVVGDEIMFLESVTIDPAAEDFRYTLGRILRGRFGTKKATHAIDARIFIFPKTLNKITSDAFAVGSEARITTTPFTDPEFSGVDSTDSDTEEVITLVGRGIAPLDPENLRTANLRDTYDANQDLLIKWDYKVRTGHKARTGAGMQGAGASTITALPEGLFRLKFKDSGDVVKREVTTTNAGTYTYTNKQMRLDFLGEPVLLKVEIIAELNGLTQERTLQITVDKSDEVIDAPQTLTPEHDSTRLDFEDDWLYGSTIWLEQSESGGGFSTVAGTANHPGVRQIFHGGFFGGAAALTMDSSLMLLRNGIVFETVVSEEGTTGFTITEIIYIGFVDNSIIAGGSVSNGTYFFWDASTATWHARCDSVIGGSTDVDTLQVASGSYQTFRIEISEVYSIASPTTAIPEARFFIDGVLLASIQIGIPVNVGEEVFPAFMVQDPAEGILALDIDSLFITAEGLAR